MSYVRFKLAQAAYDLATWVEPHWLHRAVEWHPKHPDVQRLESVLGRHIYGLDLFITDEDEEIREPLKALVARWLKTRQERSTYRSRVRAMSIATALCNLAVQFPPLTSERGGARKRGTPDVST
jgi:hypothetical protein